MAEAKNELLNPKTDIVFQTLFSRLNKRITKSFLSDMLNMEITNINLDVDKNLVKRHPEEKLGILDLRAELNDGIQCDVEIQLTQTERLMERVLSYWARLYVERLNRGEKYEMLKRTICILILDDRIERFKNMKHSYTKWQIREERENTTILTKDLEIGIIELPKAMEEYKKDPNNKVMQWMKFINNPNDGEVVRIMKENKNIKEAKDKLEELSQDKELRRLAFLREKWRLDYAEWMDDATKKGMKKGIEKGIQQGIQQGIEKGIQQGIQQGIEKGIQQGIQQGIEQGIQQGIQQGIEQGIQQQKKEMIQKLHQLGLKLEEIAKVVDMPKEKVQECMGTKLE